MTMHLNHGYRWYQSLADNGRPDLAAVNAALANRPHLAYLWYRRDGFDPRSAWRLASRPDRDDRAMNFQ